MDEHFGWALAVLAAAIIGFIAARVARSRRRPSVLSGDRLTHAGLLFGLRQREGESEAEFRIRVVSSIRAPRR